MEDKTDKKKVGIKSILQFAEKWLSDHFGVFLGENAVLSKAIAILFTAFVIFLNYLKHQYDVGYYHEVFGVPKEYLGSAWNSTISDFLLYALFSILQSIVTFLVFSLLLAFLVIVYISSHPDEDYTIRDFIKEPKVIIGCIAVLSFVITGPVGPWLRLLVSLYVVIFLVAIVSLILDTYIKSKARTSDDSKSADAGIPRKWKSVLIVIVVVMLFMSGGFSKWFGRQMAYDVQTLKYISVEEGISQQLYETIDISSDYQDHLHWAIIYQMGDNYLIAPCIIRETSSSVRIYAKYQCIIPSEGVVVVSEVVPSILVYRNSSISKYNSGVSESESTEPTETQNLTEPEETYSTSETGEYSESTTP